ncbi:MAG: PAS domain S-box protein [Gemmatimonadetes bacterium]|nr:PAS domain S-box protein [Gemmatimonadota bacterium]
MSYKTERVTDPGRLAIPEPSTDSNEDRYRVLLESTPLVPWEADARTWRFNYVGPQAEQLLGFPVERWYEDTFWVDRIHPDDRPETIDTCLRLSEKGGHYDIEYRMIRADGAVVWICDVVGVEMQDGKPALLRGFLVDITKRKEAEAARAESEQLMRLMADSLPALIGYVDTNQRYRFGNKAFEEWFGISPAEIEGRSVRDVVGAERYEAIRANIETALAGDAVSYSMVFQFPDDSPHDIDVRYVPHIAENGTVAGFFVWAQDMTDQKKAAESLRRYRDELSHVSRVATMGELATSIAHELNQPLSAIVTNAQAAMRFLATKGSDPEEVTDALADIAADGKRAGDVIRHMRGLLKKGDVDRAPVNVNDLVRGVAELLHSDAVSRQVAIHFELAEGIPPVDGAATQLEQVVLNLMANALESMSGEEIAQRDLFVATALRDDGFLEIAVTDTGKGLDPELVSEIFDPFVTTKPGGLGMGLSISRSIVETHGGSLKASVDEQGRTCFQIVLPALTAETG